MEENLDTRDAVGVYRERLRKAQREITKLYHDANNPLAILVGNAQLALEIAASMKLGEEILEPLEDIDRALQKLTQHMDRLAEIGKQLEADLGGRASA